MEGESLYSIDDLHEAAEFIATKTHEPSDVGISDEVFMEMLHLAVDKGVNPDTLVAGIALGMVMERQRMDNLRELG